MAGIFNFDALLQRIGDQTEDPSYTGGGGGSVGSQATTSTGDGFGTLVDGEGGLLARAYGRHIAIGHIADFRHSAGPPPSVKAVYMLGEGVWDSCEKAWYAGDELAASANGTDPGWHFHPGTQSTGTGDPVQGVDSFIPDGITYNKTANVVVKLPEKHASEQRPDKFRGRFKCLKVANYDNTGAETDAGSYSANPARVAADIIIKAGKLPASRIDWPSWVAWRDYCAATLSWNDGATTHTIPRFEAHPVFTDAVDVPVALDLCCLVSCTRWQDDGDKIKFLLPTDTTSVHTFRANNIVLSKIRVVPSDIQAAPRHILAKFRDVLDEYFTEGSAEVRRDLLINAYGDRVTTRAFPNMNHSQAQRIIAYQMRLESDYFFFVELSAAGDSMHVLPGDFVTIQIGDLFIDGNYLVNETSDNSPESTPDERQFRLQKITGSLYSDSDHAPIQRPA